MANLAEILCEFDALSSTDSQHPPKTHLEFLVPLDALVMDSYHPGFINLRQF